MIIVRVWGGIGNQLFQYAFGEYIKNITLQDVAYDIFSYSKSKNVRGLEINELFPDIKLYEKDLKLSSTLGVYNRLMRLRFRCNPKATFILEKELNIADPYLYDNSRLIYMQGYWQKKEYAKWLVENIKLDFPETNVPCLIKDYENEMINSKNSVALHIRRGDFFSKENIDKFGVCDKDYYQKAINLMQEKLDATKFFIFSDDLNWVNQNLKIPPESIIVQNADIEQFWYIYLMSICKHNIIPNSTFSWWGALINKNQNKIVISPTCWIKNGSLNLSMDEWIKL